MPTGYFLHGIVSTRRGKASALLRIQSDFSL
jgi:hypothetical protein